MHIIINDKPCQSSVGEKLSRVAQENKAHVGYVCAGLGICQTCYVTVFEGGECLSSLSDVEKAFLSEKQIDEGARLACQATIEKEGKIRVLSRPEEVRRMILSNPLSLFSYSVEMGKAAAERFGPGVTNVIGRIQKGEMQGQAALDEALSGMGSALQSSLDAARESIPFKEQVNAMIGFCKKMLPFSDDTQSRGGEEKIERVLTLGRQQQGAVSVNEDIEPSVLSKGFEALGFVVADKLASAGINSYADLLERGKDPQGRKELAVALDLAEKEVLTLVNYADLCRVTGIGMKIASLLEAAGVDTVPELAQRNPSNLFERIREVNEVKHILERPPSRQDVSSWVAEAKMLPRIMTY